MNMAERLRALIAGDPFIAPDCSTALTARIVELAGFEAAYMGGHATGMVHYAIPDIGILTPTEMLEQAGRVAEVISIPLIVDADQCGESIADVHRTVMRYERIGVAGIHMEDEVTPKHSAFHGPLMAVNEMQERIAAAVAARRSDLVIIARCDEFQVQGGGGTGSLDEAISRGRAYAEAGADVYLPTFGTEEQLGAIAAEVPLPLACYGPILPKVQMSLATGWGTATMAREHLRWARELHRTGELPAAAFDFPEKNKLIGQAEYDGIVERWARHTGRPIREN
jgi:2-methylisocitrate lyase-like PEP mutase family enzyme